MPESHENKSTFYQAFIRDEQRCIYCGKNMMETLDAFALIDRDHLKPSKAGGSLDDVDNMVISCRVCNSLKGSFDPMPDVELNANNRELFLNKAKEFVEKKRSGEIPNDYYKDYYHTILNQFLLELYSYLFYLDQ